MNQIVCRSYLPHLRVPWSWQVSWAPKPSNWDDSRGHTGLVHALDNTVGVWVVSVEWGLCVWKLKHVGRTNLDVLGIGQAIRMWAKGQSCGSWTTLDGKSEHCPSTCINILSSIELDIDPEGVCRLVMDEIRFGSHLNHVWIYTCQQIRMKRINRFSKWRVSSYSAQFWTRIRELYSTKGRCTSLSNRGSMWSSWYCSWRRHKSNSRAADQPNSKLIWHFRLSCIMLLRILNRALKTKQIIDALAGVHWNLSAGRNWKYWCISCWRRPGLAPRGSIVWLQKPTTL